MRKSKTSSQVKDRYNAKAYDEIKVRVPKGKKDEIKAAAELEGKSVNAYIVEAIIEKIRGTDNSRKSDSLNQQAAADPAGTLS